MTRCLATGCHTRASYLVTTGPSFFVACPVHAARAALGALRSGAEVNVISLETKRPIVLVLPRIMGEKHYGKGRVLFY